MRWRLATTTASLSVASSAQFLASLTVSDVKRTGQCTSAGAKQLRLVVVVGSGVLLTCNMAAKSQKYCTVLRFEHRVF